MRPSQRKKIGMWPSAHKRLPTPGLTHPMSSVLFTGRKISTEIAKKSVICGLNNYLLIIQLLSELNIVEKIQSECSIRRFTLIKEPMNNQ